MHAMQCKKIEYHDKLEAGFNLHRLMSTKRTDNLHVDL